MRSAKPEEVFLAFYIGLIALYIGWAFVYFANYISFTGILSKNSLNCLHSIVSYNFIYLKKLFHIVILQAQPYFLFDPNPISSLCKYFLVTLKCTDK